MLLYDGIVFSLQRTGGISVLFLEILSRLPAGSFALSGSQAGPPPALRGVPYTHLAPRRFERYRPARVRHGYDVFHSTYYRLPDRAGGKIVTTVYDYVYERFAGWARRSVHSWQKRKAVAGSDLIICISESTRRDLIEFSGASAAERAIVIPCGVSDAFHPIPGTTTRPQVLFVGARGGYKNFAAVVDAVGGLPDLELVCVGGGPFTRAETAMLERRVPRRYRAAGYVGTAELNAEYNRSLCLAYPSRYEGFGIPILEAMRAGCPVIAVNRSSIPEVAGDAAELLESGHPDEIRSAVGRLMTSSRREDLVRRGRAQAARFSWDATVTRTVAAYEELSGRRLA